MKSLPRVIGCPSSLGCSGQISRQPHLARLLSGLFGRLAGRPGGPSPEGLLDLYAELLGRQAIRFMGDLRILFGYDVPRYPTLTMVVLFFSSARARAFRLPHPTREGWTRAVCWRVPWTATTCTRRAW